MHAGGRGESTGLYAEVRKFAPHRKELVRKKSVLVKRCSLGWKARLAWLFLLPIPGLVPWIGGCSAEWYRKSADQQVTGIIDKERKKLFGEDAHFEVEQRPLPMEVVSKSGETKDLQRTPPPTPEPPKDLLTEKELEKQKTAAPPPKRPESSSVDAPPLSNPARLPSDAPPSAGISFINPSRPCGVAVLPASAPVRRGPTAPRPLDTRLGSNPVAPPIVLRRSGLSA